MQLIACAICLCLAAVYTAITYLGVRNPKQPTWASSSWVGQFHSLVIVALLFSGVAGLIAAAVEIAATPGLYGVVEYGSVAGLFLVTFVVVKSLRIKQRLTEYNRIMPMHA